MHRASNVGKGQSLHALFSCTILQAPPTVRQPGGSRSPYFWDFYSDSITQSRLNIIIPFAAFLPFRENGGQAALKISSFKTWLFCLVTSPHLGAIQESTQSRLMRTKDTPTTQVIIRVSGALCQKPGLKTKYQNKRCSFALISQEITGFQELCASSHARAQHLYFLLSHNCEFYMPQLTSLDIESSCS